MQWLFPWAFCTLFSVLRADHIIEQRNNSCGTLSLISSECKRSDVILRYTPSNDLSVSKVQWELIYFLPDIAGWMEAYNSSALSIFANDSKHYIVWRTRENERRVTDFKITVDSQPTCTGVFSPIRVNYYNFTDCTTNGTPTSTSTPKIVTWSTNRRDDIGPVSKGTGATKRETTQRTTNMNSGMNHEKGTVNLDSESTDADKTEDKEATTRLDSRIDTNTQETNSRILSTEQNLQSNHGTVATRKTNTVNRNESRVLTVILATLGGVMCVVIIVIAVLVYRKRKGNKPQDDNGDRSLQQDAQRDRGVRNGNEFVSQDSPEVLYAQVERKHKTLQNASLVSQLQTNKADRHGDDVQQTETVPQNLTVTPKGEETVSDVTAVIPNSEDNKQELVYIQVDMDHLNKSSTQRKSAERKDEDKTEYVGIDFAKTSQIQAN